MPEAEVMSYQAETRYIPLRSVLPAPHYQKERMEKKYYSHIYGKKREEVKDHLSLTSSLCEKYAREIGCPKYGRIIGGCHDFGKNTKRFQGVLNGTEHKINHALPGAAALFNEFPDLFADDYGRQAAFGIIRGHHAGLTGEFDGDMIDEVEETAEGVRSDWDWEEDGKVNSLSSDEEYENIVSRIREQNFEKAESLAEIASLANIEKMLFVRLIYSCLVDSDYTATQSFKEGKAVSEYENKYKKWEEMIILLDRYRERFRVLPGKGLPINRLRNRVYENAHRAGMNAEAGLYSMTAPTGTAKTLAMLGFALECARKNRQKRIFVVLPYLTIIDQTVDVYNRIFGENFVLEDDSAVEYKKGPQRENSSMKLLAERWDSQVIITTNVRFFETMFSSKPKVLRKLHSLANSVILYDEAQAQPSDLTDATINALSALKRYNTTVLLSTATPPDYGVRRGIKQTPVEIIEDVSGLYTEYEKIHKTDVRFLENSVSYNDLSAMLAGYKQVLCIFNTTQKAWKMYNTMKKERRENLLILYTKMCPEHRRQVIRQVRHLLDKKEPCILISTQCVEAGVDIDFPVLCREYAPYPSVIQSFGRCNRNGTGEGKAFVFRLSGDSVYGFPDRRYCVESRITQNLAKDRGYNIDPSDMSIRKQYYRQVFGGDGPESADKDALIQAVRDMDFVATDREYKVIDNDKEQISIIVPFEDKDKTYEKILNRFKNSEYVITKRTMAEAHPITVTIYEDSGYAESVMSKCSPLYTKYMGELYKTNWYIMTEKEGYSREYGLNLETSKGGLFA